MILTVDCGNTHVTLGCVDADMNVTAVSRIPTDQADTEFGYAAKFKQIFDLLGIDISKLRGAIVSCVVPPVADVLSRAVHLLTGHTPLMVGAGIKTGLHLFINDPGTVASDLVAAAVAAKELYPLPCIVVDMGTATTVTAIDERGRFIGGAFYPGADISLTALAQRTALLPHIEIQPPQHAISANTVDCMRSGVLYGHASMIDGMIDRIRQEFGKDLFILATGGMASTVIPLCRHEIHVDEALVLKGLHILYQKNHI